MSKVKVLSPELHQFVTKYFINMDFNDLDEIGTVYALDNLSHVEKVLSKILMSNYEDTDPELWFNREMCMRALVILTQLDPFAQMLIDSGYIQRGLMLLERVVNTFHQKVLSDPEIVKAIQENRLEDELEKHFPIEMLVKRTSNFVEIKDDSDLEMIPEDYKPVPEKF
ncbi:MAG: hypothetical protein U0457_08900 [Candidatus Sericytochromatia bacterium]